MRLFQRKVVVVGLFSARASDPDAELQKLTAFLEAAGAHVVGRVLQRRGVSRAKRPGGSKQLDAPLAPTVIGEGKAREVAVLCREVGADLVVMWNELTARQREQLTEVVGVQVGDAATVGAKRIISRT